LGPAHFASVAGLAASCADAFETPLGSIPVDAEALRTVLALPQVEWMDEAHTREHSLEVHLPFLQEALDDFRVVPLLVGETTFEEVAEVIDLLWGGPETFFVVSSDLSHFHDYETAAQLDRATSAAVAEMRFHELGPQQACGFRPVAGLLSAAQRRGLRAQILDVRNSGDTSGSRDRVVGYGAYVVR
jgi:AmmeMemoRadiSam system protein B